MYDKWGEVINSKQTYLKITNRLKQNKAVIIGWTDEESTHFDIMLKLGVEKYGTLQRGLQDFYLYVGIVDHTFYGFRTDMISDSSYIKEKLRMDNSCGDKVAELINGVIKELRK